MRSTALVLLTLTMATPLGLRAEPPAAFPYGAVDPDGKVAYVANAEKGIDAVDLDNGKTLWSSKQYCRPVAVAGSRLVAYASNGGRLQVPRAGHREGGQGDFQVPCPQFPQAPPAGERPELVLPGNRPGGGRQPAPGLAGPRPRAARRPHG